MAFDLGPIAVSDQDFREAYDARKELADACNLDVEEMFPYLKTPFWQGTWKNPIQHQMIFS